ncbi:MAG TPA: ATP-binding cassette domain-containing protein [Candidatus Woesebacteria bacterium]|nr:ATP-binding cassette domain-containing protein [Candidatus Woesebacteria bacterium]
MIVFSAVSKSFADNQTAIVDLSLEINNGDLVVITGPSGAGKTTLMKLLIREYLPTSGEIIFEGRPLSKFKKSEIPGLRRQIGVVFQDYKLIEDMNVWENIALPLYICNKKESEIESRVTDLLNLVGLADKALQFPGQLSGGEAQRVSIARALAIAPKVIFADEPTGNLDSEASIKITRLLKKINELGTTLLFATHDQLVLNELGKEKIIHLEKPTQKMNKESDKDEQIDQERAEIKNKQAKLAKKINEKIQNKEDQKDKGQEKSRIGLPNLPKFKLKINLKAKKEEKKKDEST